MHKKKQHRSRQKKISSRLAGTLKSHAKEANSDIQTAVGPPNPKHKQKKKTTTKKTTSCEKPKFDVAKTGEHSNKTWDQHEQETPFFHSLIGSPTIWCLQTLERGAEAIGLEYKVAATTPPDKIQVFLANPEANRYLNQVCLDETRVKVQGSDNDYINANYVTLFLDRPHQFICAQGPLDETVEQFWRMVWDEETSCIVMLCECYENRQSKCANYWPTELGTYLKHGIFTIKNLGSSMEFDSTTVLTLLEIKTETKSRTLKHLQYKNWPDQGVPTEAATPHRMLRYMDSVKTLIHCSAGVGRTATLILIVAAIQVLKRGQLLEMPVLLERIREQRAGAVQNDMQYIYCHLAVLDYYKDQLDQEKVTKFGKDLEAIMGDRKEKRRLQRRKKSK